MDSDRQPINHFDQVPRFHPDSHSNKSHLDKEFDDSPSQSQRASQTSDMSPELIPHRGPNRTKSDNFDKINSTQAAQSQNSRMLIYSVGVLLLSVLVFGGIGYGVVRYLNKNSDAATQVTPTANSVENNSSDSASQANDNVSKLPDEGLPAVPDGFIADQSYSNAYFPDTVINYSLTWNYINETSLSEYPDLIKRNITLTKDTSVISIAFRPKIVTGCVGETKDLTKYREIAGTNLSRFRLVNSDTYYYLPSSVGDVFSLECAGIATQIFTTIDSSLSPEYGKAFESDKKVISLISITLQSSNPAEIVEADAMIAQSKFNIITE